MANVEWDNANNRIVATADPNHSGYILVSFTQGTIPRKVEVRSTNAPMGHDINVDIVTCNFGSLPNTTTATIGQIIPIHVWPTVPGTVQTITIKPCYDASLSTCTSMAGPGSIGHTFDHFETSFAEATSKCEVSHWNFDIGGSYNSIGITVVISDDGFGGGVLMAAEAPDELELADIV